jgi:hypothetical protein
MSAVETPRKGRNWSGKAVAIGFALVAIASAYAGVWAIERVRSVVVVWVPAEARALSEGREVAFLDAAATSRKTLRLKATDTASVRLELPVKERRIGHVYVVHEVEGAESGQLWTAAWDGGRLPPHPLPLAGAAGAEVHVGERRIEVTVPGERIGAAAARQRLLIVASRDALPTEAVATWAHALPSLEGHDTDPTGSVIWTRVDLVIPVDGDVSLR